MEKLYILVRKSDSIDFRHALNEQCLLEISTPKHYSKEAFSDYLLNFMESEEYDEVIKIQAKHQLGFKRNVDKLVDIYRKEFELDIMIKSRLLSDTKKKCQTKLSIHGILVEGHMQVNAALQFFPEELARKIIRGEVYIVANKYQKLLGRFDDDSISYHVPLSANELDVLKEEYKNAYMTYICEVYDKHILCV